MLGHAIWKYQKTLIEMNTMNTGHFPSFIQWTFVALKYCLNDCWLHIYSKTHLASGWSDFVTICKSLSGPWLQKEEKSHSSGWIRQLCCWMPGSGSFLYRAQEAFTVPLARLVEECELRRGRGPRDVKVTHSRARLLIHEVRPPYGTPLFWGA